MVMTATVAIQFDRPLTSVWIASMVITTALIFRALHAP